MHKLLAILLTFFILGCNDKNENLSKIEVSDKIQLTEIEQQWIRENPIVRWTVEQNRPPYVWHRENVAFGMSTDYIQIVSDKTGLLFLPVFTKNISQSLNLLRRGKVDVISSIRASPSRSEYMRFSPPFAYSRIILVFNTKKTNTPLKMGVVDGAAVTEYLKARFTHVELIFFSSDGEILEALDKSVIDVGAMDYYSFLFFKSDQKSNYLNTPIDFDHTASLGYSNTDEILGSILTKAIASISRNQKEQILKRWVK